MKTITEYGDIKKAEKALSAIKAGGKFNGVVYAKNHSNGINSDLSVYVSGELFSLGRVGIKKVEAIKAEFLAEVESFTAATSIKPILATKETLPAGNFGKGNYEFGTENWLVSGMNGE